MRFSLLCTTSLALAAPFGASALAQQAPVTPAGNSATTPPPADPAGNNSDIVVTAQRREEKLFNVPITVHVVTGQTIDRENLTSLRDVLEHSPQVSYQQTGDMRTDTLSIRGLSSVSNDSGVEPDAAIVIDGETLSRTMEMNYQAFDVQRVEILEGPQGTLFGKNAVAGLINITTRPPALDTKLSGYAKVDIAEDNEYRLKGSLNIPVTENSALYVTGYGAHMGGWVQNVHPGQPNGGAENDAGFRAQYLWKPDPTLTITVKGEYTYQKTGIIPYAFKELSEADVIAASKTLSGGTAMVAQFNALLADSGINLVTPTGVSTPIVNGTRSYLYNDRTWGHTHSYAFSVHADKDLPNAAIHYLGTYRYFNLYSNDNEWGVSAPQLTNSPAGLDTLDYAGPSVEKTVQQELRIQSTGSSKLNYVAGLFYYYNSNYHQETTRTCNDAVYGYYNGSGYPNPNPINPVNNFQCTGGYDGHYFVTDFQSSVMTNNEAAFADVQYKPFGGLTVFGGVRMLWEQQHMKMQHFQDDNGAPYFYSSANPYGLLDVHDHRDAFTHRIGAMYDFGPVMIYGSQSTSFKGVSWDNYAQASETLASQPLAPERPSQWEVGMRGQLFNGKLDWQADAFDLHDRNFQARTIIRDPRFQLAVVNAGTAVTRGIQGGINATLFNGFRVGGGYTWLPTATLVDDVLIPDGKITLDYKGARMPNAPEHAYNLYADYRFAFPDKSLMSDIRFELRHRGQQQSVLTEDTLQIVNAYSVSDLYYTIGPRNEAWSITLAVHNLFNQLYYQRSYEPAVMGFTYGQMAYLPRDYTRYVGANFTKKF